MHANAPPPPPPRLRRRRRSFATITLATVGYGDLHAFSPVEAGFMVAIVFFNIFVGACELSGRGGRPLLGVPLDCTPVLFPRCAALVAEPCVSTPLAWLPALPPRTADMIGSVTLLVVKGDERVGQYRQMQQHLQAYSSINALPLDLRESMASHLKLHFNSSERNDEAVLGAYPSTIRRRVLRYLYLDILQVGAASAVHAHSAAPRLQHAAPGRAPTCASSPALPCSSSSRQTSNLFIGARQRFLDALLAAARVEVYLPGVELVSEGDTVNELFIIVSGRLSSYRVSTLWSAEVGASGSADVRGS